MIDKKEKLKRNINNHLRKMTRQLIKFDTFQETLNYLLESFYREFTCDLVAVIFNENEKLIPKAWIGEGFTIETNLCLELENCSPNLLKDALWWPNDQQDHIHCEFHNAIQRENLSTWFTVPLKNNNKSIGLCVIGFREYVPLVVEAEKTFAEFGHDVAVAMDLAQDKEKQKRKIKGIEWFRENIFPGSSTEQVIEKTVFRAGKGTQAKGASIYLFDEINSCFTLHPPTYGIAVTARNIAIESNQTLDNYFPFVEKAGGNKLTIPLVVNLKTIGVIYVCGNEKHEFTEEDLDYLKFVSAFVSMQIENARLYKFEIESKKRLEKIMNHHQELVKQTVEGEDLYDISKTISSMLESSILLCDRFLNPISYYFKEKETSFYSLFETEFLNQTQQIKQLKSKELWLNTNNYVPCSVWPVVGGSEVLGYLFVWITKEKLDRVLRLTLDYALNVYAIEFVKQKLVLDAKEKVKEGFINQLFEETLENKEKVIQYATLINWNLKDSHRIATLSLSIKYDSGVEPNLVDFENYKTRVWEYIKSTLTFIDPKLIFSKKGDELILVVHEGIDPGQSRNFWKRLFQQINMEAKKESPQTKVYLGVGGVTKGIDDYYTCYLEAGQAANVVSNRYPEGGYAFYDDLGSYTILNNTSDRQSAQLFIDRHLGPLLKYENKVDLFATLEVFLNNNGNLKSASEQLFIHRSTLEYRLRRISQLLQIDLEDAEARFELMMAYKLYSLYNPGNK